MHQPKLTLHSFKTMTGSGYGDRDFSQNCTSCSRSLNHELLRVAKFQKDAENLLLYDWPMGGTILTQEGTITVDEGQGNFANRLVKLELRTHIPEMIANDPLPMIEKVKKLIETAIVNKEVLRKVNANVRKLTRGSISRSDAIDIRRMMGKYWDNSSIFALELGSAVIRQSVFVEKMQGLDWLHSPAAAGTVARLLVKYERFIALMSNFPEKMAVPTLDVDLGWHTHRM